MSCPSAPAGWWWEDLDPNRSTGSADFARLFRNQHDKKPGFLSQGAPTRSAYLLAREVIQNAWDAADARRRQKTTKTAPPPPQDS